MKTLSIDLETYSSAYISKTGVYRYSESPDFEIMLFSYSIDGAPVQLVDLTCGERIPAEVKEALSDPSVTKWAFNASFERICLSRWLGLPSGTYLEPQQWRCSMIWSAYLGLPLSLAGVGAVLKLDKQKAIHSAKNALPIDMDSEVGLNAKRQEIARVLKHMTDVRNAEVVINGGGTGYRFNQEGNQVTYRCDVKRVTTINFDRKVVRNLAAEMNRRADLISAELDRCMVNSEVAYEAPFDVNDSFSEIFDAFADAQGKD